MPAKSKEALERKKDRKRLREWHARARAREDKIELLGGTRSDVMPSLPNVSLIEFWDDWAKKRTNYLFNLMYPKRKLSEQEKRKRRLNKKKREFYASLSPEQKKARYRKRFYRKYAEKHRQQYLEKINLGEPRSEKDLTDKFTQWGMLYAGAESRAKKAGLPFNLTPEYVYKLYKETLVCPFLGVEFVRGSRYYGRSLDKIIPSRGYIVGNVQILSRRANTLKNNATFEEFEKVYLGWKKLQHPPEPLV